MINARLEEEVNREWEHLTYNLFDNIFDKHLISNFSAYRKMRDYLEEILYDKLHIKFKYNVSEKIDLNLETFSDITFIEFFTCYKKIREQVI